MTKPDFKLSKIRIDGLPGGPQLQVFSPSMRSVIERRAKAALKKGASVTWEDGTMEWWDFVVRTDTTQFGSKQYTWDKAGDKVLADFVKKYQDKNGNVTKEVVGTRFVDFPE